MVYINISDKAEELAFKITNYAKRAIIFEVSTTPKPGLVDRLNDGAHKDMNFLTFLKSSSAIFKGLKSCALEGVNFKGENSIELMDRIRNPGISCEKDMLRATVGVNTHKGIIFSLGVLLAASGKLITLRKDSSLKAEDICSEVIRMAQGLIHKDFMNLEDKENLTHGELLYKRDGIRGIRGEVEEGFPTVRNYALPLIREWSLKRELSLNELFLEILMNIMANNEDTNVLARAGKAGLDYTKKSAKEFIKLGGIRKKGYEELLQELNRDFVCKNISPGGSADLLAVSIFLASMEGVF